MVSDQPVVNAPAVTGSTTVNTRMDREGLAHPCWNKKLHVFKLEYKSSSIQNTLLLRSRYTTLTHRPTSPKVLLSYLISNLPISLHQYHLRQVLKRVSLYMFIITLSHHYLAASSPTQFTWGDFSPSSWWAQEEPPRQIVLES
jgi:hypothetical protein